MSVSCFFAHPVTAGVLISGFQSHNWLGYPPIEPFGRYQYLRIIPEILPERDLSRYGGRLFQLPADLRRCLSSRPSAALQVSVVSLDLGQCCGDTP